MPENTLSSLKAVVDTNTFFSALYNKRGNEALLFELANDGYFTIFLLDYVIDELKRVYLREGIDEKGITDILDTYNNVIVIELENMSVDDIALAKKLIPDVGDRPIFAFARKMLELEEDTYFISGDEVFFSDASKKALNGRVVKTRQFIDILKEKKIL